MLKNTAGQSIGAQLTSATTGLAFTGAVTVYVTGDRGTQAIGTVASGVCVHEGNGFHSYGPSQAETNYDHIAFSFVGTGAITVAVQVYPESAQAIALTLGATIPLQIGEVTGLDEPLVIGDDYTIDVGRRIPITLTDINGDAIAVVYGTHTLDTDCTIKMLFHPEGRNTVDTALTGTCAYVAAVGLTPAYLWLTLPRSETVKAAPAKYQTQIEVVWTDGFTVTMAYTGVAKFARDLRRLS